MQTQQILKKIANSAIIFHSPRLSRPHRLKICHHLGLEKRRWFEQRLWLRSIHILKVEKAIQISWVCLQQKRLTPEPECCEPKTVPKAVRHGNTSNYYASHRPGNVFVYGLKVLQHRWSMMIGNSWEKSDQDLIWKDFSLFCSVPKTRNCSCFRKQKESPHLLPPGLMSKDLAKTKTFQKVKDTPQQLRATLLDVLKKRPYNLI